jgi:iron-sulfur cluster assembly accessory protein
MSLTNVPPIDASTSQPVTDADGVANDKSAAALDEDDTLFEGEKGAMVVMDGPSLELLKGSKVDFTTELIGSQFKIADNPLATSSCGCGTSFDIKM